MNDAAAVLQSLTARLGRSPTLVELLQEMGVEPSGTPTPPTHAPQDASPHSMVSPSEEAGVDNTGLTALVQRQDLLRQAGDEYGDNPLLALLRPLLQALFLGHGGAPEGGPFIPNGAAYSMGRGTGSAPGRVV